MIAYSSAYFIAEVSKKTEINRPFTEANVGEGGSGAAAPRSKIQGVAKWAAK
jgi:hypothetical protein